MENLRHNRLNMADERFNLLLLWLSQDETGEEIKTMAITFSFMVVVANLGGTTE